MRLKISHIIIITVLYSFLVGLKSGAVLLLEYRTALVLKVEVEEGIQNTGDPRTRQDKTDVARPPSLNK